MLKCKHFQSDLNSHMILEAEDYLYDENRLYICLLDPSDMTSNSDPITNVFIITSKENLKPSSNVQKLVCIF